jgi:hypothetical protein
MTNIDWQYVALGALIVAGGLVCLAAVLARVLA